MMNNNKILTVSYGTFSCTLEGFDDSFGTMKAIAEYFRDLASDDRYFGAEPPQPDADMLARIAQKEVSRRVQAREQDGKIVLSAIEDQSAQQQTNPVPLAAAAVAATPDPVAEAPAVQAPAVEEPSVEIATTASTVDVAALDTPQDIIIEEIEDAADASDTEVAAVAPVAHEATAEDAAVAAPVAPAKPETAAQDFVEDENDIVPGQADADVEAFFADSSHALGDTSDMDQDAVEAVTAPVEVAKPAAPAPDSIAAKLQRIRAVVAQHEEEADDEDDYLEDEHAEADTSEEASVTADAVIADAAADLEDALAAEEEDIEDAQTAADMADETADTADAVIADARTDIEDALEADDTDVFEEDSAELSEDDDVTAILGRLEMLAHDTAAPTPVSKDASKVLQDVPLAQVESASEEARVEDSISNLFEDEAGLADETADSSEAAKPALRKTPRVILAEDHSDDVEDASAEPGKSAPRARVIKVKRADLEAAIDKGELEEYGDDTDTSDDADAIEDVAEMADEAQPLTTPKLDDIAPSRGKKRSALSPEDEADLARELAELEEDNADAPQDPDTPTRAARRADVARHTLPAIDESTETDVNRLLAETDHQMDEPESATRRDAFAHLRAAVAAKKADVAMGGSGQDEEGDGAYREDLAEVVRPRRPTSTAARTERPGDARPAPLKLVAEQRIDVQKPVANAGPVRPRRISAAAEEALPGPDGENFTDFAADMGATTLPQLLEAAAAYMSFVEGRDQFSRPQLMTKVRQAGGPDGFSREEGLRSFGQLLRAGKIEKIKGGRFTVSDEIGYRPDERAAS
ncbi:putative lipoprotein [Sulfitobacter geojensis]|uniref:hypothetical protein n=2 Tax=Sulfitobacter geojensis TaxID=1342299 RepID=UPI00046AE222|nr:putative lipoprotein [Sulfitobacter geojensis]